jgi:hypothetical protein
MIDDERARNAHTKLVQRTVLDAALAILEWAGDDTDLARLLWAQTFEEAGCIVRGDGSDAPSCTPDSNGYTH